MLKGTVRWFSNSHGYGFIQDASGKDIFVHYSVIRKPGYKSLEDGQEVGFELGLGPKGEHATVVIPEPDNTNYAAP
jgi:CspA family cold shock protein